MLIALVLFLVGVAFIAFLPFGVLPGGILIAVVIVAFILSVPREGRWGGRHQRLVAVAIVLVGIIAIGYWGSQPSEGELPDLHADLATEAERVGVGGTFALSDVADFAWDRAHIFPPYSEFEVEAELGFPWSPLSPFAGLLFENLYLGSEGLNLIVFVDGERTITGWSILAAMDDNQPYLEMSRTGRPVTIQRSADLLSVEQPPHLDGNDAYLLAPPEN